MSINPTHIVTAGKLWVQISNDLGGTSELPDGRYKVGLVTRSGRGLKGVLVEGKDLEVARKAGTTGAPPENANFDPSVVYFSTLQCEPIAQQSKRGTP